MTERPKWADLFGIDPDYPTEPDWQARAEAAEAEIQRLRKLLADHAEDALEDVQEWGAYASDYFTEKWDLAGAVAKWERRRDLNRAALDAEQPRSNS